MGSNPHTHQRTQLTIATNIIEREFVATAILSYTHAVCQYNTWSQRCMYEGQPLEGIGNSSASNRCPWLRTGVCVCVFFPFILDMKFVGRTSRGHMHRRKVIHDLFFMHLPSALIFLARRIQPFLSLVDREVEFCALTILSFSTPWAFFLFFSEKNLVYRDRTHVPTCKKVTRLPLGYRGDQLAAIIASYLPNSYDS